MDIDENSQIDPRILPLDKKDNNDDFNLLELLNIFQKRKKIILVVTGLFFTISTIYTVYKRIFKPVYKGSFVLLISDPINSKKNNVGNLQGEVFEDLALNKAENDLPTLIAFMKSPFLLEPIAEKYDINPKKLEKILNIENPNIQKKQAKGVLRVSILVNNKSKGLKILTELSDSFLDASLQQKRKKLNDGLDFLNKQMPAIQNRTRKFQIQLSNFREKYSLIEPSVEGGDLKMQQTQINTSILQTEAEKNKLFNVRDKIVKGRISTKGFNEAIGSNTANAGEGLSIIGFDQTLLNELLAIEGELAKAKSKYTPSSKIIKGLERHQARIKPLILSNQLEAVDTAISLTNDRLNTLLKQKEDIEFRFLKKPSLIREYNNIEQNLNISKQNLLGLISAKEKFQLEMAQESVPWRIISSPRMESKAIEPKILQNLLMGIIYGLISGSLLAYIREKSNYVFNTVDEVRDFLKIPIIGKVPYFEMFGDVRSSKKNLLSVIEEKKKIKDSKEDTYQRFFYQESFRSIYTSIRYLSSDKNLKSIVITSCLPKEGKSVLNTLLAKTLSELGKNVLQIDCDLRKPTLHKLIGLNNLKGVSNLLVDNEMDIDEVIQKVPNNKNWSVITSGVIPPDPARLLGSNRMKNIIKKLQNSKEYDLIIYDTPPASGISDYLLLADKLDGTILIITINSINKYIAKEVYSKIIETKIPFLGCITNETEKSKGISYLSSYGKGYNYNYGAYKYAYADYAEEKTSDDQDLEYGSLENDLNKETSRGDLTRNKFLNYYSKIKIKINDFISWIEK